MFRLRKKSVDEADGWMSVQKDLEGKKSVPAFLKRIFLKSESQDPCCWFMSWFMSFDIDYGPPLASIEASCFVDRSRARGLNHY